MNNTEHFLKSRRIIIVSIISIILVCVALSLLASWDETRGLYPEQNSDDTTLIYNGTEYTLNKDAETFLIIGLKEIENDGKNNSYHNDLAAELLTLFILDKNTRTCSALAIDGKTIAKINVLDVAGNKISTVTEPISLAHTYGKGGDVSCRNTVDAVEKLLGVKIDHSMSFDIEAMAVFAELLNGVKIDGKNISADDTIEYLISTEGEPVRAKRQEKFFEAVTLKFVEMLENDENFNLSASLALKEYVVSLRSLSQYKSLAQKIVSYDYIVVDTIDGEKTETGFVADEDSLKKTVVDLFYKPIN